MRDANSHNVYSDSLCNYLEAEKSHRLIVLDIIRLIGDLPLAIYFIEPSRLDPGFVSFFGTITSAIGCY